MSTFENCQLETDASVENCQPKPVKCGCGGEARIGKIYGDAWTVECTECGIQSGCYDTEAEAITAWNTAMTPHCCMTCQNWHWSKECSTNARDFCDDYEGWS